MKFKVFFCALMFATSFSYSQDNVKHQEIKLGNYTIKSMINSDKTYGFTIYFQSQSRPLVEQKSKSYLQNNTGFIEKQNAVVVAIWYVNQLKEFKNDTKKVKLTLSKAKELGITEDDLD